jgi:hypothetical protein
MRTEAQFIEAIDCRFPYADERHALELIDEGCAISANAAYMVVHELARRPHGNKLADSTCLKLLDLVDARFTHPVKDLVLGVARRMVQRERVPLEECAAIMRDVGRHRDQYNALAVVYFACEDDQMETVERLHDDIIAAWRRSN